MRIVFLAQNMRSLQASEFTRNLERITVIGRDSADIVIADKKVSRQHCALISENGKLTIRDLNSRNGTHLNEKKIVEGEIKEGDELTIGNYRLVFNVIEGLHTVDTIAREESPTTIGKAMPMENAEDSHSGAEREANEETAQNNLGKIKEQIIHGWPDAFFAMPKPKQDAFSKFVNNKGSKSRR